MIHQRVRKFTEVTPGDIFSPDDGLTWFVFVSHTEHGGLSVQRYGEGDELGKRETLVFATSDQTALVQIHTVAVRLEYVLDVDIKAWSTEYGIDCRAGVVRDDVRTYFGQLSDLLPEHLRGIVVPRGESVR